MEATVLVMNAKYFFSGTWERQHHRQIDAIRATYG